jgi:molybdenum cofactor synthesis domain-containing protein
VILVAEALQILREACPPGPAERVPLAEASGRFLARPVVADEDWPPFDTSAMDGYAVRVADLATGGPGVSLRERAGLVAAGDRPPGRLEAGEAVRVMTGAPIPEGTEAIVPTEDARREDGRVFSKAAAVPRAGDHIRRRGESIAAGTVLLEPGQRVSAAGIALAAFAGADPLEVHRRPRLAIAVTGNELVPVTSKPGPGQHRDSNGPMLAALCRASGRPAATRAAVADEDGAVARLFREAGREEDVLVTSGGVSAGDLDLLPAEAERAGFEILFHGVAVRPGKPVAVGRRGETLWFGLPGNPVSASVGFHLFVRFALGCREGASAPGAERRRARLVRDVAVRGARETYRDGVLEDVEGELRVEPLRSLGSHDFAAHSRANVLIRIPSGADRLPAGSLVDCLWLER